MKWRDPSFPPNSDLILPNIGETKVIKEISNPVDLNKCLGKNNGQKIEKRRNPPFGSFVNQTSNKQKEILFLLFSTHKDLFPSFSQSPKQSEIQLKSTNRCKYEGPI